MKIAIPVQNNLLCQHFGHCQQFYICEVNESQKEIVTHELVTPPPHEPGLLPRWLHERNVNVIITGGMGQKAQELFAERGIQVFPGAPSMQPEELVKKYLAGELIYGENACDH
ncbi:MAG: NifB/NifX family molybdenum-iron cluster-binding protein [Clostridia bacterium]|nr:NifB/NifX family molybdenum-iron cluster-binding protein [Clostridia bacterium]